MSPADRRARVDGMTRSGDRCAVPAAEDRSLDAVLPAGTVDWMIWR